MPLEKSIIDRSSPIPGVPPQPFPATTKRTTNTLALNAMLVEGWRFWENRRLAVAPSSQLMAGGNADLAVDVFDAEVLSARDFYPGACPERGTSRRGMVMPGRQYAANSYRYGFQAQESDFEWLGEGNSVAFKYRVHDPRLGRFLGVDPLAPDYPWNSGYAFSENRVIDSRELEGLERYYSTNGQFLGQVGADIRIRLLELTEKYSAKRAEQLIADANSSDPVRNSFAPFSSNYFPLTEGFKAASIETSNSRDEVAYAWGFDYNAESIVFNVEYTSVICKIQIRGKDGDPPEVYFHGAVVGDDRNSAGPEDSKYPAQAEVVAAIHSHGSGTPPGSGMTGADDFSTRQLGFTGDKDWARRKKYPLYLATPSGELKVYDPKTDTERNLNRMLPYDPNHSNVPRMGTPHRDMPAYPWEKAWHNEHPLRKDILMYER